MTDTSNPWAALSGFFLAGDKNDPRVNPVLRQRLALAMLARDRKYPKNLGEGIAAVGANFADAITQRQLEQADLAQQDQAAKLIAPPGAGPAQGTSIASSSDSLENASAVKAIEAATSQPQVIPPPAPPPSAPPPQAPGRGFTPVPMQPGAGEIIDPGEYNALDAADPRNRYKPAPAYLQPALERNIADPERRGYLGQTAGKESRSANEVSPTGAGGPFQFTRGTGAQYGLRPPGGPDLRFDPDASTIAADRLTSDNVATLTAKLGREPTPGEMALAHQQGAGTAANMLTGAGNAPSQNLAVNNVSPSLGPQAAAQKVMAYYGMPGAGVTTPGPRDAVAAALLQQQQPPPSGLPTVADYGQPPVLAFTGADAGNNIQAAPPAPSGIRAAPPQQVAQAQPQAVPGYVPPPPGAPQGPPIVRPDPELLRLRALAATTAVQNNGYAQTLLKAQMDPLEAEHAIKQNAANEQYKAQIARDTEQIKMREQARIDQAKNIAEEARLRGQARKDAIVENPEEKYVMGPDSVVRPIKVEGEDPNAAPGGKLSEAEQKTLIYHGWAKLGNQAITGNDQLLAHGMAQEALGKIPFVGNAAQDAEYRRAKNGADNFILSFMRSTSGAAYGVSERLDHAKAMLPKIGDDAKTLADKAAQRQQFIDTEYAGLGKQAQKKADYMAKNYDPGSASNQQRLIDMEMQGVKGGQVGEVKTNKNPKSPDFGKQRMWNGSRWVEAN